ncbi:MAG: hypothetical protein KGH79_02345 [Patescibacteria group bacterium]|nr:hypothetical protein [Patescibacteria group bacterium]
MKAGRYLPSAKFTLLMGSLALSAGLVYAAELWAHPPAPAQVAVDTSQTALSGNSNWEAALYAIQAANASSSLQAPNTNVVAQLLAAAQSPNVTDSIGRTLLINLSNAQSQGLGDDIPTQNQIVAIAAAQAASAKATTTVYSLSDLSIVPVSAAALHAYGNAVIQTLNAYPDANEQATFISIDEAVEGGDKNQAAALAKIGAAYQAAGLALLAVPVPQTLAPLHLQIVNNLLQTSTTYTDMQTIGSDPVRGLEGLQTYQSLTEEGARMFINIAQELNKDGILFTKDEPGSAWSIFLAPTGAPSS